jgi:hypothetical protein
MQVLHVLPGALHLIKLIHCVLSTPSRCPCTEGLLDNVTNVGCPFNPSTNLMEKQKEKKTLSKSKNQRKQNIANLIILTCG